MTKCDYCQIIQQHWGDGKCPHCCAPLARPELPPRYTFSGVVSSVAHGDMVQIPYFGGGLTFGDE